MGDLVVSECHVFSERADKAMSTGKHAESNVKHDPTQPCVTRALAVTSQNVAEWHAPRVTLNAELHSAVIYAYLQMRTSK